MKLIVGDLSPEQLKYSANYIGSKMRLVNWIWSHTPPQMDSVLDAFSGSSVVGYTYKTKGLRVVANDRLRWNYHAACAIIENSSITLDENEVERLLVHHGGVYTFVQEKFADLFFKPGVHKVIDTIRTNIELSQSGFKESIALFALARTCVTCRPGGFGHFCSSTEMGFDSGDSPEEFAQRFRETVQMINALVFDNGQVNRATNLDVNDALAEADVELAYFDPPYATEFSVTNYEKTYHFVEGLMTYWRDKEFTEGSKLNTYKTTHEVVTRKSAYGFFRRFLGSAQHIPHWIISYRDKAYPDEEEMAKIIEEFGRISQLESKEHKYYITTAHSDASQANELIYICRDPATILKEDTRPQADAQSAWDDLENQLF